MVNGKSHIKLGRWGRDKSSARVARVHRAHHRFLVGCERLWIVDTRRGLGGCSLPSSEKPNYYATDECEPNYTTNYTTSDRPDIGFLFRRR